MTCERILACLVRRFGRKFPGGHPVLPWLVKYSVAMVNRCRRGPDGKTAYELRKGRKFGRTLPHFAEKTRRESNQDGRALRGHRERHAQGSNTQTSRSYRTDITGPRVQKTPELCSLM